MENMKEDARRLVRQLNKEENGAAGELLSSPEAKELLKVLSSNRSEVQKIKGALESGDTDGARAELERVLSGAEGRSALLALAEKLKK